MDTPKRHHLTIHQKLRIIEESKKPGFNRKDAMEKYRISKASLSRVLKSQTNKIQESKNTKGFNLRSGKNHELEMELYEWLVSMNNNTFSSPFRKKYTPYSISFFTALCYHLIF